MIKRSLLYIAIGTIGSWLITTLITGDWNPGAWDEQIRFHIFNLCMVIAVAAFLVGEKR
jgi:hypothetical protein